MPKAHLVHNRISELIVPSVFGIAVLSFLSSCCCRQDDDVVVVAAVVQACCFSKESTDAIRDNNPFSLARVGWDRLAWVRLRFAWVRLGLDIASAGLGLRLA